MSLKYSFTGKKVLITGGGQGIGRKLVKRFYNDGANVYTIDKNAETLKQLKEDFPNVTAEVADLTDWEETRRVVESFGVIDCLVNNAGLLISEKFMKITKETANLQFDVNIGAMINVTQVVAKGLMDARQEGSVVNISSLAARICYKKLGISVYGATKAGVENLTKSMAMDLGPHKIRVNCILPGFVDSPIGHQHLRRNTVCAGYIQNGGSNGLLSVSQIGQGHMRRNSMCTEALQNELLGRMAVYKRTILPQEIADLTMFLLSPLSSMIVGQGVVIDGGFLCQ